MNQTTIINKLNDLKYDGFKSAYLRQIEDTNYSKLSFDERVYNLLEAQEIFLQNKRILNFLIENWPTILKTFDPPVN